MTKSSQTDPAAEEADERPICGVIMPISQTGNFEAGHWEKVRMLLHLSIEKSGFRPKNVWDGAEKDSITEKIVGNIFQYSMAVADISALNPNVMLELGMRLASKKPTIVVAHSGSAIPFDIKDFHVETYPSDMGMVDMELFLDKLTDQIKAKSSEFSKGNYTPFLSKFVIEVLSPEVKESEPDILIMRKLDEISRKIERLERPANTGILNALANVAPSAQSINLPRFGPFKAMIKFPKNLGRIVTNRANSLGLTLNRVNSYVDNNIGAIVETSSSIYSNDALVRSLMEVGVAEIEIMATP